MPPFPNRNPGYARYIGYAFLSLSYAEQYRSEREGGKPKKNEKKNEKMKDGEEGKWGEHESSLFDFSFEC